MALLEQIKLFEGKNDTDRRLILERLLKKHGIKYTKEQFYAGYNVITTKQGISDREILAICHTDAFSDSPGANDNASAVVVLVDVLRRMKKYNPNNTIKIIFFDQEEIFCVGSREYVKKHGVEDTLAVLDLELVGRGDIVGIWPITRKVAKSKLLKSIHRVCKKQKIPHEDAKRIPMFWGDYLPFREEGVKESVCLTLIPKEEANTVRRFAAGSKMRITLLYLFRLLKVPDFFKHYHSPLDTSSYLHEKDLQKMVKVVYEVIIDLDKQL